MVIYIIASGGGHTTYAIAVAEELKELMSMSKIKFVVPANDRLSVERIVSRFNRVEVLAVTKPRNPLEGIDKFFIRSPKTFYECLTSVDEPEIVVGTGSNFMMYPMLVSLIRGCNYLISVEAIDRVYTYSKANYVSSKLLKAKILLHWYVQRRNYPEGVVVGPIIPKPRYKPRDEGYVLVTSGTVGHRRLINLLIESGLNNVVAQIGDLDVNYVVSRRSNWIVFNYDPDLERWIARASVVITHQGVTAAEAAVNYGKPVIIAYNPDLPQTSTYVDTYGLSKLINAKFLDITKVSTSNIKEVINAIKNKAINVRYPSGAFKAAAIISKLVKYVSSR